MLKRFFRGNFVTVRHGHNFYSCVRNDDWSAAQLLEEILCIRDDDFTVLFSDGKRLSTSELNCILSYVASIRS